MTQVYIRLYKNNKVYGKSAVKLKDVAGISGPSDKVGQLSELSILTPEPNKRSFYAISALELIEHIQNHDPTLAIKSVGEIDGVIDFNPSPKKTNRLQEIIKIIFVGAIIFAGSTVAIMTYHTDTSLGDTFTVLYEVFSGERVDNPMWLTIPYSIGMPLGIIIFYNHFGKKKFSNDPTPIQVEMVTYNNQVDDTLIEVGMAKKRGQPE